jgi:hypothetical protein
VYYESGTCKDDTVVFVNYTDAYVDAGLDKTICNGDEVVLSAENLLMQLLIGIMV